MSNLIGISGKIGSGKDTLFEIINRNSSHNYENKKFASILKEIGAMLLGVTPEMFEDREFKEKKLDQQWWCYDIPGEGLRPRWSYPDQKDNLIAEKRFLVALTPRMILQKLGTEGGRMSIHPNIWVNALFASYQPKFTMDSEKWNKPISNWIITDVRFPNEADAIKERGGTMIRINRIEGAEEAIKKLIYGDSDTGDHPSETALDDYDGFDLVINNNGTIEDLEYAVKSLIYAGVV